QNERPRHPCSTFFPYTTLFRSDAGILALGPRFGIDARYLDPAPFKTKLEGEGERRYIEAVRASSPDLIVLAGFMRVVKPGFLERSEEHTSELQSRQNLVCRLLL